MKSDEQRIADEHFDQLRFEHLSNQQLQFCIDVATRELAERRGVRPAAPIRVKIDVEPITPEILQLCWLDGYRSATLAHNDDTADWPQERKDALVDASAIASSFLALEGAIRSMGSTFEQIMPKRGEPVSSEHVVFLDDAFRVSDMRNISEIATGARLRFTPNSYFALYRACKRFVWKCDNGQARSKESYDQMKDAIAAAEGRNA